MVTLRKAHVNCPKCGHGFTARDNGKLSPQEADKVWRTFEEVHSTMRKAFDKLNKILH